MTRRGWISRVVGVSFAPSWTRLARAAEFWQTRTASEWTSAEIAELTTRSPWARMVNIEIPVAGMAAGTASTANNGPQRDPTTPAGGAPPAPMGRRRSGPRRGQLLVRWESAEAIREALRTPLPRSFEGHYVVSVAGIDPELAAPRKPGGDAPVEHLSPEQLAMHLKDGAELEAKGHEPLPAGVIESTGKLHDTWLFGFSREFLPLTEADRDVSFALRSGAIRFRVDFDLKRMRYKGALSV